MVLKIIIAFNYKEGTTAMTFNDLKAVLAEQNTDLDLDCLTAPRRRGLCIVRDGVFFSPFWIVLYHV